MELNWLDDGNLYLLLPDGLMKTWGGTGNGDYDRACAASDSWLSTFPVGDGVGLVLGGDPGMALVVPEENEVVVLIRWVFAEDEHALVAFARRGEGVARTEPDLVLDNPEPNWWLFDAAVDSGNSGFASRQVTLPIGKLRVQTTYQQAGTNAAIVHRFTRMKSP